MCYLFAFLLFFNVAAVDDIAIENSRIDRVLENNTFMNKKSNVIKPVLEIALKEPIRYVNFWIKTNKLKKEGKQVSGAFKFLTTFRFAGNLISDACYISLIVNQLLAVDQQFLDGTNFYFWIGSFSFGEMLNVLSRAIVRENYKEESIQFL